MDMVSWAQWGSMCLIRLLGALERAYVKRMAAMELKLPAACDIVGL